MAYIQPNSRIEFFSDIGLSQDYNDTLYFPSTQAKDDYFTNSVYGLAHVDRCYYARENRGFVRVELPMTTMIHAQYMRFKNTSYENKWWYAFVTDVIYVNDNTTEVRFELDVMMTWMGEFTLSPCFVERQHSDRDYIGYNTVPESLSYDAPVIRKRSLAGATGGFSCVIFMSHKDVSWIDPGQTLELFQPSYTGGVVNGLDMIYCGNYQALQYVINKLIDEVWIEDVVAIKMLPSNYKPPTGSTNITNATIDVTDDKPYSDISGYVPKNNKLFTYPYNYLTIDNSEGQQNTYRYEWFGQLPPAVNNYSTFRFSAKGAWSIDMQLIIVPNNYLGNDVVVPFNYEERIAMQDFPSCAWNVDAFKAMMAQKESNLPTRLLASAMSTAALTMTNKNNTSVGNFYREGAINSGIQQISDILANKILPPNMPTLVKGSQGSNVLIGEGNKDFILTQWNLNRQDAEIIDNYFTMFGYADNKVHVPNMNARNRFTYVKTQACKINCRCPASDADIIENLFNRGIRFWKSHTDIGNYTDANLPIGG